MHNPMSEAVDAAANVTQLKRNVFPIQFSIEPRMRWTAAFDPPLSRPFRPFRVPIRAIRAIRSSKNDARREYSRLASVWVRVGLWPKNQAGCRTLMVMPSTISLTFSR